MTYCNTMWRFLAAMRIILLMIFCWILYHWPVSSYKYFPAITRNYLGSRNLPLHPTFLQCKCFTLQWNCRASYLIDLLWSLVSSETTYLLQCHVALVCTNCTLWLQKMEIKMSLSTSWNTWDLRLETWDVPCVTSWATLFDDWGKSDISRLLSHFLCTLSSPWLWCCGGLEG